MQVVYEDNHIIIVAKQSGEIVQGDKTGDEPLSEAVKRYLKEKYQNYIDKAMTQELSKKLDTESHMSEDAKKLQADNDWLSMLNDKRLEIEGR